MVGKLWLICLGMLGMAQADPLIVRTELGSFSVKAPEDWRGDQGAASKHDANIVFCPSNELSKSADVTIRVRLIKKADERIATLLAANMDMYRKKYPDVQIGELMIDHPSYATYSKLCFVPRQFYDYVSYINAGQDVPYIFAVEMSVAKRPANAYERTALDSVARTLRVIDPNK